MTLEKKPIRVLIVDDSLAVLWGLGKLIQGEFPRMTVIGTAHTDDEALVYAWLRPDVIVLDIDLGGCSCIEIIPALKRRSDGGVLIHTGHSDRRLHQDAVLFGATDVIVKDASAESLLGAIADSHAGRRRSPAIEPPSPTRLASAAAAIAGLTSADRRLIADLVRYFLDPPAGACPVPPAISSIVSLYDALGLRNRIELCRFAAAHDLVEPEAGLSAE